MDSFYKIAAPGCKDQAQEKPPDAVHPEESELPISPPIESPDPHENEDIILQVSS